MHPRLLRFGFGVELAQNEVLPLMSALIEDKGSDVTVMKRLFSSLCALRTLRPEVGLDLQVVKVLALRLRKDARELGLAVQEALEDLA